MLPHLLTSPGGNVNERGAQIDHEQFVTLCANVESFEPILTDHAVELPVLRNSFRAPEKQVADANEIVIAVDEGPLGIYDADEKFSSTISSLLIHLALILVATVLTTAMRKPATPHQIMVVMEPPLNVKDVLEEIDHSIDLEMLQFAADLIELEEQLDVPETPDPQPRPEATDAPKGPAPVAQPRKPKLSFQRINEPTGGGLGGRNHPARSGILLARGGSASSEKSVVNGLKWLAAHQRPEGGWNFDHSDGMCDGRCLNPGTVRTTTGATALALLPFLGAGNTHLEGNYAEVVQRGLAYLVSRQIKTPHGGDLQEGTMYAHGLASIALCEAYAMSGDSWLRNPAQQAIDYICYAQHSAGGWRYFPGQPGDATVTGWQLMALKSGQLAGLEVPNQVIERISMFLDHIETGGGAYYGYLSGDKQPTPTAIGQLSRMYLGRKRNDPRLARGVDYLERLGPSKDNMYFNYYASQVLHHYEARGWKSWNQQLRDLLIAEQATEGHEQGSWFFADEHALSAGRLFNTAICVMILEVYYRYMPLYREQTVQQGFAQASGG